MIPRIVGLMLALSALVLVAPEHVSPVEQVAAYCIQIEGVDDCANPCMDAAGAYNTVRRETGTGDKTPPAYCPA